MTFEHFGVGLRDVTILDKKSKAFIELLSFDFFFD